MGDNNKQHNMLFSKDDIIKGRFWNEPIIIKFIENIGDRIHIIGEGYTSKQHIDRLINIDELEDIEKINIKFFSQPAWKVFLSFETLRYRYASLYDPLLAMNVSKIDPLPHQIEAVYGYILKLPRIRFLIADDPGAGKTIMAGLIIKELKLRHIVKRLLIVCPGHLKDQWSRELKDKFDEIFEVIDRSRFDAVYGENVWNRENQLITSLDFAKQGDILQTLAASNFDLIIVDEAHKMSAYQYGNRTEKSERYKLGEVLSKISNHLLFLTATPHKGDPENFRLFLDLLESGFFATTKLLRESIDNRDNPLFIRRIKEDLKDFDGKPLFLPRYVNTVGFNLSNKERDLYNELSKYVENQYNKSLANDKKRNIAFALVILQRRLASSTYALLKSLERRKKKLTGILQGKDQQPLISASITEEELEELSEEDRWREENKLETFSISETEEELMREIDTIDKLINLANEIINTEVEIKLTKLRESLKELSEKVSEKDKRKILIFTESRDTLEYLELKINSWGYSTNTIHGGMKLESRINAEKIFKNEKEIMIATEAAGEGINLQFCNLMVNFDIPWNPNRLEQRMGRIHRYGQLREVFVHNLVSIDTREGLVMNKLFEKIEEIKNALGSDKVFDVIGDIIDSRQFKQALLDAAVNARNIDEILQTLDITVDERYINRIKDALGETLATHFIDYNQIKEMAKKAKEHRLIPEYTQEYFIKAFEKAGGRIRRNDKTGTYSIDNVPNEIRRFSENESFKKVYGNILRSYPNITFDKEFVKRIPNVEFVSFGHPLFESVMQWVENFAVEVTQRGGIFYDPDGKLNGFILYFEGEIKDGTNDIAGKRLFSIFVSDNEVKPISPYILWDLIEENNPVNEELMDSFEINDLKTKSEKYAINLLEEYKKELFEERERQAKIKEKYGIKSLEHLIIKLDGDLIDLYKRKDYGENVDLAIRNKQDSKSKYEKSLVELKEIIEKEKSLSMTMPKFLGIIRVKPYSGEIEYTKSNDDIESIGMRIATEFEIKSGRNPVDVSSENLGYDIRSEDIEGKTRYIEVKARAQQDYVVLTQNEWLKAKRFGEDYYLYVVYNAASSPELLIIPNPANNLKSELLFENIRFLVNKDEILNKALKV